MLELESGCCRAGADASTSVRLPLRPYPPNFHPGKNRIFTVIEPAEGRFHSQGRFIDEDNSYDTCIRSDGQTQYGEPLGAILNLSQNLCLFHQLLKGCPTSMSCEGPCSWKLRTCDASVTASAAASLQLHCSVLQCLCSNVMNSLMLALQP